MFFGASSSIPFSHNNSKFSVRHVSNTTSEVTGLFWRHQDGLTSQLQTAEKAVFTLENCHIGKKSTVFPSKVETSLLSRNLTYENFGFSSTYKLIFVFNHPEVAT